MRSIQGALIALLATTLLSCAAPAPVIDPAPSVAMTIEKSPNDSREYKYLVLPNKLRVLLVSDPATDKSAAALTVFRGSYHEPDHRPGIAHFLEHMLFIGTEKYPEVDTFQKYIQGNGGSSNAYTASDHTNYFFNTQPAAFREGLDRFAHFFIDPLLSEEYVEREKNAVHSEYQMQIKQDNWRQMMVAKLAQNQAHPGAKFNIGSLETLAGDVKTDLHKFKAEHYSADQMGLVVLTEESIAEMQGWVVPLFSAIPNTDLGPSHPDEPLFTAENLPATIYSQPIKDDLAVEFTFPIPATRTLYEKKPEAYISNLIGHEGTGSLHKLLNSKGWIESLSAGGAEFDINNSLLVVRIELTPAGKAKIPEITDLLFQYIDLLKQQPPQQWLYDEQATVAQLAFRFQEKGSPLGFAYQLAPRLDRYPASDLLTATSLMKSFDPELITEFIGYLRRDNVLVEIIDQSVATDSVEPWFEVPYKLVKGPIESRAYPTDELHLPSQNPYLPDDLALLPQDDSGIAKSVDKPGLTLWQDTDTEFGTPRANLYLELAVDGGFVTARDRAFAQIYRTVVQDSLSESVYPAYLAGLGYSMSVPNTGYGVTINGFQDKQLVLLGDVLEAVTSTEIKPDRFETLKATMIKEWGNFTKEYPYQQSMNAITDILISSRWPMTLLADAARDATHEDLAEWRQEKLAALKVVGLMHGNVDAAEVDALQKLLADKIPLQELDRTRPELESISEALLFEIPIEHNDASMVIYVQDDAEDYRTRATTTLAGQIIRAPYFTSLRTNQQLGYVVSAGSRMLEKRNGMLFLVQSPAKGPDHLEEATRLFLDDYVDNWDGVSDAEFEQQKAGLINSIMQTDKNLRQRSGRYWGDIVEENFDFNTRERIAAEVETLSKADVGAYFASLRKKLKEQRLLVFSRGKFEGAPSDGRKLESATAFKS